MYIHEMIKETHRLRDYMTPENDAYFGEMVRTLRSSRLNEAEGEEVLLRLAKEILKGQDQNKTALDLYEEAPEVHAQRLVDTLFVRQPRSTKDKIKYYIMIPWVALTWVFFIMTLTGFFSKWFGGDLTYTRISTATLLLIAGGSIILIEGLTRFMKPEAKKEELVADQKMNPRTMGIYIGIAAGILIVAVLLVRFLPAFVLSPWDSLILFVIGLAGQKFYFLRKTTNTKSYA
ncbi:putative membrane-anchored protein [Paenibacillus shirakamiensis]|uniref:Membrane-anchored protein n=1 Tax=Paenibacillus shirakamiensis TaxID=1265935 RepID=A0ABS4JIQ3_9BACL|nr:DUF1129 family protein [Paenibacillus shirakamiensis]MBP2000876.1 putative membrane-anchored protein [Paenibacillus shirakamiensis]